MHLHAYRLPRTQTGARRADARNGSTAAASDLGGSDPQVRIRPRLRRHLSLTHAVNRLRWLRGPATTCRRTGRWASFSRSGSKSVFQSRPQYSPNGLSRYALPRPLDNSRPLTHAPLTFPTRSLGRTIAACEDALPTVPSRFAPPQGHIRESDVSRTTGAIFTACIQSVGPLRHARQ